MGGEDAFDQAKNIGAMEDVELRGVLFKNLGEGKFLDCASSVVGGIEGDVSRRSHRRVCERRLDGYKAIVG